MNSENYYFDKEIPKTTDNLSQLRYDLQNKRQENKELNSEYIKEEVYINQLKEETKRINKLLSDDIVIIFT